MSLRAAPRENVIERHLLRRCRERGLLCLKFTSPSRAGVPDRIVITPTIGTVFVELKRPGGQPTARQQATHRKIRSFGGQIWVISSTADVDAFIARTAASADDRGAA